MARLKLGSDIKFDIRAPIMSEIEPIMEETSESINFEESLPDLSYIDEKLLDFKLQLDSTKEDLETRVDNISSSLDHLHQKIEDARIELSKPEIKHITYVKDVTPEILDECKKMINLSKADIIVEITNLQILNRKQSLVNKVLTGALIFAIILHLV